jgi:hypothetical protein
VFLPGAGLDCDPHIYTSHVVEMTGVYYHTQLIGEKGISHFGWAGLKP